MQPYISFPILATPDTRPRRPIRDVHRCRTKDPP
jgi:hypothetical protein